MVYVTPPPRSVTLVAATSTLSTVVSVLAKFISPYLQQITLKVRQGEGGRGGEGRGEGRGNQGGSWK